MALHQTQRRISAEPTSKASLKRPNHFFHIKGELLKRFERINTPVLATKSIIPIITLQTGKKNNGKCPHTKKELNQSCRR